MPQQQGPRQIIFHADDDEDDRMLFLDAVAELNLQLKVEQAQDGQRLLDILWRTASEMPEMVFLDINMPGKNGFDCLKEIRRASGWQNKLKVIMLSTSSNIENIELSYELGADFYAVKPSTFEGFKRLLASIMSLDWNISKRDRKEFLLFEK
ncbi:response regulator [Flavobacterium sp. DG2-3]|uniref:response regulator n=1 Tax=Flavobacterium sp. DG2-3 TaxID=3068317 RepID=UPI00273EE74C|nr:response regulator [Flavobacterium sp. DG2-3]MDP5200339.1 response regulator [Flavobacterium sp. DG2-3]